LRRHSRPGRDKRALPCAHGAARSWVLAAIALVIVLLAAAIIAVVVLYRRPQPPPTVVTAPVAPPQPESAAAAAQQAVVAYLQHLQNDEYQAAYELLTADSRKRHSLEEFQRLAKQGIPFYDRSSATVSLTGADRAEVTLHQTEDPASITITAAKENGLWRIVYLRGRPGSPYP